MGSVSRRFNPVDAASLHPLERITGWITTHWITVADIDARKGRQWRLFENVSTIRPGIDPGPFVVHLLRRLVCVCGKNSASVPVRYLIGTVACLKPQKAPEDVIAVAKLVCSGRRERDSS